MQAAIIVIDSFGIGESPDAGKYGDSGSNTALHICESVKGPKWPVLKKLGLGNCSEIAGNILPGCEPVMHPLAGFSAMMEKSPGKGTTTGHWEIAGILLDKSFHTFKPDYPSFPEDLISAFKKETGLDVLGNKAASGIKIIEELGSEHIKTGKPIVYTSADSVFQIAAHDSVIPLKKLYELCKVARKLCDPLKVARVIARPFTGEPGSFKRTKKRRDFSIALPSKSILAHLQENGVETVGIGKIGNIFNEKSITRNYPDKGNPDCMNRTLEVLSTKTTIDRFIFVNLVDTDMHYGHRRDVQGYFNAVTEIDSWLPEVMDSLKEDDFLIITADHGCDPSFKGTDHTREYVPLLAYFKDNRFKNKDLGIRDGFYDIAQTLADYFNVPAVKNGKSFLR